MSVGQALEFVKQTTLTERERVIAASITKEIDSRLSFLNSVGLSYLTLSRSAGTLSGGESQRIRLATQIGSSLSGVLYILDEPSIGLHQRDNDKLIGTLKNLRDLGNTVVVVEHDEDTMYAADHIIDIGPGAGIHGGELVCAGTIDDIKNCERSETGLYLSRKKCISVPQERRKGSGEILTVKGAYQNNLKSIAFCCISTGLFGFPKVEAAEIAVRTTSDWLAQNNSSLQVVFNVFGKEDELIYRDVLGI